MATTTFDAAVPIARRLAGKYPLEGTYHEARLARQAPALVERATALVADETGLEAPGSPDVAVVSRGEWVESNIASFSQLVAPATEQLGREHKVG